MPGVFVVCKGFEADRGGAFDKVFRGEEELTAFDLTTDAARFVLEASTGLTAAMGPVVSSGGISSGHGAGVTDH